MAQNHQVEQGECISSIAEQYGFFPDSIWNDPANAELKRERNSPDILLPGDVVVIPDLSEHQESAATEKKHRFRRKGVPALLKLQILREVEEEAPPAPEGKSQDESEYEAPDFEPLERKDEPVADAEFFLDVDGVEQKGKTDGEGRLEVPIPPGATTGRLRIVPESGEEMILEINLGNMDPIDTNSGIQSRLCNLGFTCEQSGETRASALRMFQEKYELPITGEADDDTLAKLEEIHGS